jgi:4-hydroxymandelate oxidase
MRPRQITRREALTGSGAATRPPRLAPLDELVDALEFEEEAKKVLSPGAYALIAGGDRTLFDRITFRPRMLVPTLDMDLGVTIAGTQHFAPILVAPISEQKRFHADGELGTVTGAAAAKAVTVVSARSSVPLDQLVQTGAPLWVQVYAADPAAKAQVQAAVKAGVGAIVVAVGATAPAAGAQTPVAASRVDWKTVDALKQGVATPVFVKGVQATSEAREVLQHDVQGLIVSNYGGVVGPSKDAMILTLPAVVDQVAGKVPVLVDGSFRRGTDILKALVFGAQAVLIGRPVMWGLAAYGADGVQSVLEMLQSELARYMAMSGKSHLAMLDRSMIKVHGVLPR